MKLNQLLPKLIGLKFKYLVLIKKWPFNIQNNDKRISLTLIMEEINPKSLYLTSDFVTDSYNYRELI